MLGADDVIYKNRYVWDRYKNDLTDTLEVRDYYEQLQGYLNGQVED